MHCTRAITIQQTTGGVPLIMPKENLRTIPYFEPQKLFSNISKFQQLLPTPRTIIGDRNLPKALPFQPIHFYPTHPKRFGLGEKGPNMLQNGSIIPYFQIFDT
jgi:hypothetical protein